MVKRYVLDKANYPKDYVLLDAETTGLLSVAEYQNQIGKEDYLIELSAIKVRDNKVVDKFDDMLYLPEGVTLSKNIINITGITEKEIAEKGRNRKQVLIDFAHFIKGELLTGYNVKFDLRFVCREYQENWGKIPPNEYFDIYSDLSLKYITGTSNHKLGTLYNELSLGAEEQTHRALDDAHMAKDVYDYLRKRVTPSTPSVNSGARDVKTGKLI